jgi:uncharacterized protein YndB with AHSA1/START domain
MKISYSIDIKSTPEAVFRWLERPEKAMLWMTSVTKTEILNETKEMVGTTFREVVEENGDAIEMQGAVTSWKPNVSISFHLTSKVNIVDVEYCIEGTHDGVRLTENANIQWKFPVNIFSAIVGDRLKQKIVAQSQKEFGKLKQLVESDVSHMKNA